MFIDTVSCVAFCHCWTELVLAQFVHHNRVATVIKKASFRAPVLLSFLDCRFVVVIYFSFMNIYMLFL